MNEKSKWDTWIWELTQTHMFANLIYFREQII